MWHYDPYYVVTDTGVNIAAFYYSRDRNEFLAMNPDAGYMTLETYQGKTPG